VQLIKLQPGEMEMCAYIHNIEMRGFGSI